MDHSHDSADNHDSAEREVQEHMEELRHHFLLGPDGEYEVTSMIDDAEVGVGAQMGWLLEGEQCSSCLLEDEESW